MRIPTAEELAILFRQHGYVMPSTWHVVILRNRRGTLNKFDDMILWLNGGKIEHAARCTADPGKGPRMDPKNPAGCAVMALGQVVDGYGWGKHKGKYECWVPLKPIPVLRYDSIEDTTGTPSTSSTVQIHRANEARESVAVDGWSEGCTVYANPNDFTAARAMVKATGQAKFTMTLMEWG